MTPYDLSNGTTAVVINSRYVQPFPKLVNKNYLIFLELIKADWCNKIDKTNFVYAIIHHILIQWFFQFMYLKDTRMDHKT